MSRSAELPARSLPELLEIAHGDIEGGHGQSNGRYFNSLLAVHQTLLLHMCPD